MVSTEAVPYAKTGGLGDVAGALPLELAKLGHDVRLIIPRYGFLDDSARQFQRVGELVVPTATSLIRAVVEQGQPPALSTKAPGRVSVFAIRHDPFFARAGLYQDHGHDYPDNLDRFSFLCRGVMALLTRFDSTEQWRPDILHLHDWQTALCAVYLKTLCAKQREFTGLKTVLTLHNVGYQGQFPKAQFEKTGLPATLFTPAGLEFYGSVNLLKGGILFADMLTTVSPTYSREIQTPEFGFGLEGVLAQRKNRLCGIVNGIDTDIWNPSADPFLPRAYSASDLSGKAACKQGLQRAMTLPVKEVPVLGIVSRLVGQKGLDLVATIIPELMELDLQLLLLGSGERRYEQEFDSFQKRYPDKIALRLGFDEGLAHRIQAGSDMVLIPSRYEPCGLTQLHGLRYGTVPVVRKTGGLADTVVPYSPQTIRHRRANGFHFTDTSPESLLSVIQLALSVHKHGNEWETLIRAGMSTDVSWGPSVQQYERVYKSLRQNQTASL